MDITDLTSEAERLVWRAFSRGEFVDLGEGNPCADDFDPNSWGDDRTVRAEVITSLLLGAVSPELGYIAKVALAGARIVGCVQLNGGTTQHELLLDRCVLTEEPDLADAHTRSIAMNDCHLPGFTGFGLRIDGSLTLVGSTVVGAVDLSGAAVGLLSLQAAKLSVPGNVAFRGNNLTVGRDLSFDGARVAGQVALSGARVAGEISFAGATLELPGHVVLDAAEVTCARALALTDGFTATGTVRLDRARVGSVDLTEARLTGDTLDALSAYGLIVDGNLDADRMIATGGVDLSSAVVADSVILREAQLTNHGGTALIALSATVKGFLLCDGMTAHGQVDLRSATLGWLVLADAKLHNPGEDALVATQVHIDHDLAARMLTVTGRIGLENAQVGGDADLTGLRMSLWAPGAGAGGHAVTAAAGGPGDSPGSGPDALVGYAAALSFIGQALLRLVGMRVTGLGLAEARLDAPDGLAIYAEDLTVTRNVMALNMVVTGAVSLGLAKIGGLLVLSGTHVTNPGKAALDCSALTAGGGVVCNSLVVEGAVSFTRAQTRTLSLSGARLSNPTGVALNAADSSLDGDLVAIQLEVTGSVNLTSVRVGGSVSVRSAVFNAPSGSAALDATLLSVTGSLACDGATINGPLVLALATLGNLSMIDTELHGSGALAMIAFQLKVVGNFVALGLRCEGDILLIGATVGGPTSFVGATITSTSPPEQDQIQSLFAALSPDPLLEKVTAQLRQYAPNAAAVTLIGATLGGGLSLSGATIRRPQGAALVAAGATIERELSAVNLTVEGQLDLTYAKINGMVVLASTTIRNAGATALDGTAMEVRDAMVCTDGCVVEGTLDLDSARLGSLLIGDTTISRPDATALYLAGMHAQDVTIDATIVGRVDLRNAQIGKLDDSAIVRGLQVRVDGLTYADLATNDARTRLRWLARDPDRYKPQPYEHLAAYYRRLGRDRDVRRVLLRKRRIHRRHEPEAWRMWKPLRQLVAMVWRVPGWLFDALAGYGYVPLRAFGWLCAAWAAGWWVFRTQPLPKPTMNPDTNAILYTLDAIVPTSPLGLEDTFAPQGWRLAVLIGLITLGYALSIAVLPAITRALGRSDSKPLD